MLFVYGCGHKEAEGSSLRRINVECRRCQDCAASLVQDRKAAHHVSFSRTGRIKASSQIWRILLQCLYIVLIMKYTFCKKYNKNVATTVAIDLKYLCVALAQWLQCRAQLCRQSSTSSNTSTETWTSPTAAPSLFLSPLSLRQELRVQIILLHLHTETEERFSASLTDGA